ncbi:NAD(P)/FAD-dependent oxidoreductase [Aliiruegeria sabulilitoris]|uniref:NAD(P)/FAD-dependent oxidoreductase n=1 Tax=Aliiruegeria sabulilitoris TaxID=1510458 RepID=UPI000829F38A|nr:FAD-dependent oxidoreductase [Aliiruegeria sabulilitoris]NDR57239.1 FAD-binding oxidoreductase [Pseudoruegeria sp. M32A2M]
MKDFLVIGGGIAGLSAAAELARSGSVVLVESEDALGYHASGRSAAMFLQSYGNSTVRALNEASADAHRRTDVLSQRGFLMVADRERGAVFEREHASFGAQRVTIAEAQGFWPILNPAHCAHAAWLEEAYDLDTDRLLQHYARQARQQGTEILTRQTVEKIRKIGDHWQVETATQTLEATQIVNAAGAWADPVARMAGIAPLGIQPMRRSMARLPAPNGLDTRNWPFVDDVSEDWYAKPDAGAWLVSPADEDPVDPHDAWADDMVIAEGLARYQPFVTVEVTRVEATWAGLRSFAPDRALVIGRDPTEPAFLWCAGQGGYGFQTAPAAAGLLAALASGASCELEANVVVAVSPARFRR